MTVQIPMNAIFLLDIVSLKNLNVFTICENLSVLCWKILFAFKAICHNDPTDLTRGDTQSQT